MVVRVVTVVVRVFTAVVSQWWCHSGVDFDVFSVSFCQFCRIPHCLRVFSAVLSFLENHCFMHFWKTTVLCISETPLFYTFLIISDILVSMSPIGQGDGERMAKSRNSEKTT